GVGRRLGQPELPRVPAIVLELQRQLDFRRDVLAGAQLEREPVEESPQDEEQRLERLDFLLEIQARRERLGGRDGVERPRLAAGGAPPEGEARGAEAADDFVARQRGEVAERAEAPAGEDGGEFGRRLGGGERERGEEGRG